MSEKRELYANIDELLREFGLDEGIGRTALKETAEVIAAVPDTDDRYGIRAAKIGHFANGLFPRLPKVA